MVYIAPGSFIMGSPLEETGRQEEEKQHRVTLTKGYYIGVCEVTQKQWQSLMRSNPSSPKNRGDDIPAHYISWREAMRFVKKLNEAEKTASYALPTEAQWEYACRATTDYEQYKRQGQYRGDAGLTVEDLGPREPSPDGQDIQGVEVIALAENGPAARGGIALKDVIMRVNGKKIAFSSTFERIVEGSPEGEILKMDIARPAGAEGAEAQVYDPLVVFVRAGRTLYPNYATPPFHFGSNPDQIGDYAWFKGNSDSRLHPVAQKPPNRWGLYDMHGNAPEWCLDRYGAYPSEEISDPKGPRHGITYRVHRGGGYYYTPERCRSAYRGGFEGSLKGANMGIRLVKNF
jgi:formylglycine-generating enzyme required for sulfatase activity